MCKEKQHSLCAVCDPVCVLFTWLAFCLCVIQLKEKPRHSRGYGVIPLRSIGENNIEC